MKTLVTGANGFLASNIIRELQKRGYPVRAMMRKGSDKKSLEGITCEFFYGNIVNPEDVMKAAQGCTYVIHVAANTSQASGYDGYIPVNVTGTANVIEAVIRNQCKRLVYISTANTFGQGTKNNPGHEGIPMSPLFKKSAYALSKAKAQELVLEAVKGNKIDAVVINPSFMLGPYDAKPSSGKIIQMYFGKRLAIVPAGGKNFVDVRDVAAGACNALGKGRSGECYLLVNQNLSYPEFVRRLNENNGYKTKTIQLPRFVLYGAGYLGNLLNLLHIPSQLNLTNAKILCTDNYYSAQKSITELDFKQTPIEKSIHDAVDWFREHHMLKK
jgi:dihydroflavonol-4-reductase